MVSFQGGAGFLDRQCDGIPRAWLLPHSPEGGQEVCGGELCSPGPCRSHFFQA